MDLTRSQVSNRGDPNNSEQNRIQTNYPPPLQIASLQEEQVKPRADLPPLLVSLAERRPEKLHYVGVSYGLTQQLFNFWKRLGMLPVYMRQTPVRVLFVFFVSLWLYMDTKCVSAPLRVWHK